MLSTVPLFSACTDKERRKIASLGTRVELKEGSTLCREDTLGLEFILLISGDARCVIRGRKVATFGPGDFFGEVSLVDGGPRTATVIAETPVDALVLDRREFSELLDGAPSIARKMIVATAARIRSVNSLTD